MNLIITIGREFGSGGRELGRRIAENLKIPYYDNEILEEIEKKTPFCLKYIEELSESKPFSILPIHYGGTLSTIQSQSLEQTNDIYVAQTKILKELASKSSCVIIGRAADYVLKEFNPFKIFVFATTESKLARCKSRDTNNTEDKVLLKQMKKIDKKRAKFYEYATGKTWANRSNYDLLINTTDSDIKKIADAVSNLLR